MTPCAFIAYYVDNIYDLYNSGKTLSDALFSDFMKNGRKWQREYGLDNWKKPKESLESDEYFEVLKKYDEELWGLTEKNWESEYLNV